MFVADPDPDLVRSGRICRMCFCNWPYLHNKREPSLLFLPINVFSAHFARSGSRTPILERDPDRLLPWKIYCCCFLFNNLDLLPSTVRSQTIRNTTSTHTPAIFRQNIRSLVGTVGTGSISISRAVSQWKLATDLVPDLYQNCLDPQHWLMRGNHILNETIIMPSHQDCFLSSNGFMLLVLKNSFTVLPCGKSRFFQ